MTHLPDFFHFNVFNEPNDLDRELEEHHLPFIFGFRLWWSRSLELPWAPDKRLIRRWFYAFMLCSAVISARDWISLIMIIAILLWICFFPPMWYPVMFTLHVYFLMFEHQWICWTVCFICGTLDWLFYCLELLFVMDSPHRNLFLSSSRLDRILLHTSTSIHIYIIFAGMLILSFFPSNKTHYLQKIQKSFLKTLRYVILLLAVYFCLWSFRVL